MTAYDEAIATRDDLMEQQAREEVECQPAKVDLPDSFTRIPKAWWGLELYDWGTKGFRVRGNRFVKVRGKRPAKRWDRIWESELTRLRPGEDTALLRFIRREVTDETWTVRQRSGKFWNVAYHMVPTRAIATARMMMDTRAKEKRRDELARLVAMANRRIMEAK